MNEWYREEFKGLRKPVVVLTDELGRPELCYKPCMEEDLDSTCNKEQDSSSFVKAIYHFLFKNHVEKDVKLDEPNINSTDFYEENYRNIS